ncbi:hypothetical protein [Flavobacterium gelatinilyticum]|uniref:hypothetical protein n=1 Tax=Flavobacterium gelatinilyticum TaxID=3003260 RepID=UPI002480389F|nr:hypothetical protein [Flavobacterium gelatinilyticum]
MNLPFIFISIVTGLICAILGYLFGKLNSKNNDSLVTSLQDDLDACNTLTKSLHTKIASLETDLKKEHKKISSRSFAEVPLVLFDETAATAVLGKKIKENDLKVVEGIGPKIEFLFNEAGITTWYALSQASTEKLQSILDTGGENYAIHNPSTWARQALLAYEGKWTDLKDWQDNLISGKE